MILDRFLNAFGSHVGLISLLISISFYKWFQIMRSRCQDECEADVKISNLKFVQSVQDNAKPTSSRMRSRCQDNAKPMSNRIWEFCRVKVGWVSNVVGANAKPMSRITRSRCQASAKSMSSGWSAILGKARIRPWRSF